MEKLKKKSKPYYVIVGNSVAGIAALEAIREIDRERPAVIIDREKRHVYSRPLISYYLEGRVDEELMRLRPSGFYKKMRAMTMLGREVKAIKPKKKQIVLDRGTRIPYKKLLLAVGAEPVVPRIKGIEGPNIFTFTRLNDAISIRKAVKKKMDVVVIGAGLIGIKAAEALKALGARVTIVEIADRPLAAVLDGEAGKIVTAHIRRKGIRLLLSRSVKKIKRKGKRIVSALLDDGDEIRCACVVVTVGVQPCPELYRDTGIKFRKGICVNNFMSTSVKGIYAAGDATEASALFEAKRNIPIWPLAYEQGRVAGTNMAGGKKEYRAGMVMNSIEVFGLPLITLGSSSGEVGEVLASRAKKGPGYKKVILKDDRIVGAIFIDDIERAGIISGLMLDEVDVGPFKGELLKENFGYIYVPREYRAKYISPLEV